jgi:signal transduction histidine kinase
MSGMADRLKNIGSWTLFPVIALFTAAALLLAGVVMAIYGEHSYKAQKIQEVSVQAQILASSVTAALMFDDTLTAQEYVSALGANPEILVAAVYDSDKALFASFARTGNLTVSNTVEMHEPFFVDDRLVVIVPVVQAGLPVGLVYLQTVTEPVSQRLLRYGGIALLITMAALVAAVFGAAHAALTRANAELKRQAVDLADANRNLQAQMMEREKAEDALRQSQKMEAIGQLSGGIAHDFNNLLTIVKGNLQLLQKRVLAGRMDVTRYVDLAMEGVNRAASLTQRILAFSRRQPLSPRPVDLSSLIAEMGVLLRHSVGPLISLETRLGSDWWTLCDANQMENVVLNLAINARDAMPGGGKLVVEVTNLHAATPPFSDVPAGDYIRLSVTDTGVGMSPEVLGKAIDPFFTTKPQGQGTGLGLSMIFGYIKQSQGHLHLASEAGAGTTATILLPRYLGEDVDAAPPTAVLHESAPLAPVTSASAPVVFVVEDEALVRELAVEAIREAGYNVLEAGDGKAALDVLASDTRIDLLASDVKLPGATGFALAEYSLRHRPDMKVMLMTGFTQDPLPEVLAQAGIRVLYKPYDVEELIGWVTQILKQEDLV